jgi:hypothetical protein
MEVVTGKIILQEYLEIPFCFLVYLTSFSSEKVILYLMRK